MTITTRSALLIAFFVAATIGSAVYLLGVALASRSLRLAVIRFGFGLGPVLVQRGRLYVRLIPWSSYFQPALRDGLIETPPELVDAIERGELRYYDDLPFMWQVALVLAPDVVLALATIALLGPTTGLRVIYDCGRSFLQGGFAPLSETPATLENAFSLVSASAHGVGLVVAAVTAYSAVWIPNNLLFVVAARHRPLPWARVRFVCFLVFHAIGFCWVIAACAWLAGRR
jgi:hypothetical protein